jgi:hypothetical protein
MDIQGKLNDLKELYDKGLITASVYEQQQRVLLAGGGGATAPQSHADASPGPAVLDPKRTLRSLWRFVIAAAVILIGIWAAYSLSDRQTKDSISQFASQTGVGKQVIPWTDRADTAARKLVERNQDKMAAVIQGITHPTGTSPSMTNFSVSKLPDRILVEMTVAWKGGFMHGDYSTTAVWEIAEKAHVQARVTFDSALTKIESKNAQALDDYFRTKVYPTFVSDTGGG